MKIIAKIKYSHTFTQTFTYIHSYIAFTYIHIHSHIFYYIHYIHYIHSLHIKCNELLYPVFTLLSTLLFTHLYFVMPMILQMLSALSLRPSNSSLHPLHLSSSNNKMYQLIPIIKAQ